MRLDQVELYGYPGFATLRWSPASLNLFVGERPGRIFEALKLITSAARGWDALGLAVTRHREAHPWGDERIVEWVLRSAPFTDEGQALRYQGVIDHVTSDWLVAYEHLQLVDDFRDETVFTREGQGLVYTPAANRSRPSGAAPKAERFVLGRDASALSFYAVTQDPRVAEAIDSLAGLAFYDRAGLTLADEPVYGGHHTRLMERGANLCNTLFDQHDVDAGPGYLLGRAQRLDPGIEGFAFRADEASQLEGWVLRGGARVPLGALEAPLRRALARLAITGSTRPPAAVYLDLADETLLPGEPALLAEGLLALARRAQVSVANMPQALGRCLSEHIDGGAEGLPAVGVVGLSEGPEGAKLTSMPPSVLRTLFE
ncbi:MAG: hypothetical protein JNK72_26715 [Myxococcales bacterium]|nr:hypothetical protein [Myxococcales bacterium]